jgi:DNA-directed RNA polymerase subunit F
VKNKISFLHNFSNLQIFNKFKNISKVNIKKIFEDLSKIIQIQQKILEPSNPISIPRLINMSLGIDHQ